VKHEPKPDKLAMELMDLAGDSMELRAQAFATLTEYKRSQVLRAASAQLAGLSWGKKLSPETRKDVARYALSQGTDPARHWEVLGGNLYDKSELWMDLVSAQDDCLGTEKDFIHFDDRASDEENKRRELERIKHGVPDDAPAACVVTIHRQGKLPAIGVNWAGSYQVARLSRKSIAEAKADPEGQIHDDPVGDENPTKSAYTRAFRKAAKTAYPLHFKRTKKAERDEGIDLTALDQIEGQIQTEREEVKAQNATLPRMADAPKALESEREPIKKRIGPGGEVVEEVYADEEARPTEGAARMHEELNTYTDGRTSPSPWPTVPHFFENCGTGPLNR
jgi:hypothetical protein